MVGSSAVAIPVVCGPTSAGKTRLALWLADRTDVTIISADSRQLYRGFDVGTASYGLTAFNFGGVVGAILGAVVIMRVGSRISMLTMGAGAVVGAVGLSMMSIGPASSVR